MSREETELALDITQFGLDIVGIFEPTPFADGTNALISVGRGDWLGAGISVLGIIPYLGDIAKAGKFPKYLKTFERAIELARKNANFARYLKPALEKIGSVLDRLPWNKLPDRIVAPLRSIQSRIHSFLGRGARNADDPLDDLVAELLMKRKGSLKNVGELTVKNIRLVADFLSKRGIPTDKMHEVLSGIDLSKPIRIQRFKAGDTVAQYTSGGAGEWFVKVQGAVDHRNIGLAQGTRSRKLFRIKEPVEALQSYATSINDSWTWGRKLDVYAPVGGLGKTKAAEMVSGGGEQFFLPGARDLLEAIE